MGIIPSYVRHVLKRLEAGGHEAWCVGGCVRDTILGKEPSDWDVATSAEPEQVMALFPRRTIPTGLRHGTVTVRSGRNTGVEVTAFRCEGPYEDHRRPSSVTFTRSLEEDLRRRDFTINAMAMGLDGEIRDPFGGREDLERGVLRCVGDPDERFSEDALRMMRGLRFAAVLGFALEEGAAESIHRNAPLLREIAPERIQMEICKLLCGPHTAEILRRFSDVTGVFWPELLEMRGFEQRSVYHCYDVWEHTLHALDASPPDLAVRLSLLFHDAGKPRCFTLDQEGRGHFYGHPAISRDMAEEMLRRLHCPKVLCKQVTRLVEWHDRHVFQTEKSTRKTLAELGAADTRRLLAVKRADNLAQAPAYRNRQEELDRAEALVDRLLAAGFCPSVQEMQIDGNDLLALGLSGRQVGEALRTLFRQVVEGELPNRREPLLEAAARIAGVPQQKKRRKRRKRHRRKSADSGA